MYCTIVSYHTNDCCLFVYVVACCIACCVMPCYNSEEHVVCRCKISQRHTVNCSELARWYVPTGRKLSCVMALLHHLAYVAVVFRIKLRIGVVGAVYLHISCAIVLLHLNVRLQYTSVMRKSPLVRFLAEETWVAYHKTCRGMMKDVCCCEISQGHIVCRCEISQGHIVCRCEISQRHIVFASAIVLLHLNPQYTSIAEEALVYFSVRGNLDCMLYNISRRD